VQAVQRRLRGLHVLIERVAADPTATLHPLLQAGEVAGHRADITAMAIHRNLLPPTVNLENPEPDLDLDFVPHKARDRKVNYAMSNSFGFSGHTRRR
jgi:3-oxoacyl-[acyl-carrier-protein] synthase II